MKTALTSVVAMLVSMQAYAGTAVPPSQRIAATDVPEAGLTGSLAALAAVAAIGVLAWERRRRARQV